MAPQIPMASRTIDELKTMATEIEDGLEMCHNNLSLAGGLSIKVRSFKSMVENVEASNPDSEMLNKRANHFLKTIQQLAQKKAYQRAELEQEMAISRIRIPKITEISGSDSEIMSDKFYSNQTNKLDGFLMSTMDSLNSLKRQSTQIKRISERVKHGLSRLGLSNSAINSIERRISYDKIIFIVLLVLLVLFVLFLRFIF